MYKRWFSSMPAMLHSIDADGRLIAVSDMWLANLGYEAAEVIGRPSTDFLTEASRRRAIDTVIPSFFRVGRCDDVEYQMVCSDGRIIDVTISAVLDAGAADEGVVSLAVITDVTERKKAERDLLESEARYRMLAEYGTDMVFQLDLNLVRRYVSPASREVLGYEPNELVGVAPVNMAHPEDADRVAEVFASLRDGRAERQSIVNRIRHRDGSWIWVEAQLRTLRDEHGAPSGIIGALRSIAARKAVEEQLAEANQRLEALAHQDGLTGLANRRAFDVALRAETERAKVQKRALSLVMIDVDHFKAFNDHYGHQAGDECLRRIGHAIRAAIRNGDLAARYGGEEFAILLPGAGEADAAQIAERIRAGVAALALKNIGTACGVMTISAGIAALNRRASISAVGDALLRRADQALYKAKATGRNKVHRAAHQKTIGLVRSPRETSCKIAPFWASEGDAARV